MNQISTLSYNVCFNYSFVLVHNLPFIKFIEINLLLYAAHLPLFITYNRVNTEEPYNSDINW